MKFSTHGQFKKIMATAAVGAAAAASIALTGGSANAATTPGGASQNRAVPNSCDINQTAVFSPGGPIYSGPTQQSTVVGEGEYGQTFTVCSTDGTNTWDYGKDNATGVWGWVQYQDLIFN
ncbi:MAG: SH3 domain-containing protein [Nocardiopsaceae bacterium]|nr:SH3 domain-containing protein [Nocardiopsaceae bacterium]